MIREAVEKDIQQYFVDSLTPTREYATPIDNVLKLFTREREKERCEHCGSDRIYHGPPDCPMCGAPNCCQTCCKITTLENTLAERDRQLAEAKVEIESLKDQYRDTKNTCDLFASDNAALKSQLAASERQRKEMEEKAVSLCEDLIHMVEEYHTCDWEPEEPFTPDFDDINKRLQSLRQSTKTEEEK